MSAETLGGISLTLILGWGIFLGVNFYRYNKSVMKNRKHFNIHSLLTQEDKIEGKKIKRKVIVSFLLVSIILVVLSVFASID